MTTIASVIQSSDLPLSFYGDRVLYAINLAGMTTLTYMGAGFAYWMASALWTNRRWDKINHPVTLYRLAWLCVGIAVTLRSVGEAGYLWSWNGRDTDAAALMLRLKWYITGASFVFTFLWLVLTVVSYAAIVEQLRRQPFPVEVWAKFPALRRPAIVACLSIIMSVGVVFLRG